MLWNGRVWVITHNVCCSKGQKLFVIKSLNDGFEKAVWHIQKGSEHTLPRTLWPCRICPFKVSHDACIIWLLLPWGCGQSGASLVELHTGQKGGERERCKDAAAEAEQHLHTVLRPSALTHGSCRAALCGLAGCDLPQAQEELFLLKASCALLSASRTLHSPAVQLSSTRDARLALLFSACLKVHGEKWRAGDYLNKWLPWWVFTFCWSMFFLSHRPSVRKCPVIDSIELN